MSFLLTLFLFAVRISFHALSSFSLCRWMLSRAAWGLFTLKVSFFLLFFNGIKNGEMEREPRRGITSTPVTRSLCRLLHSSTKGVNSHSMCPGAKYISSVYISFPFTNTRAEIVFEMSFYYSSDSIEAEKEKESLQRAKERRWGNRRENCLSLLRAQNFSPF